MALPSSPTPAGRVEARRRATIEELLDHAQVIATEEGAGAISISEIARRAGMKPPSMYKYFGSLHDVIDALFARGQTALTAFVEASTEEHDPGLDRIRAQYVAFLRWGHDNPGLAQLMFWRPIPGFVPSAEAFAPSQRLWARMRGDLATAARAEELKPAADNDDAMRLITVLASGISSQQMANEPGRSFADGAFTSLADAAFDMFLATYAP